MIPIKKEEDALWSEFKFYEKCVFCLKPTNTWHIRTNNPVCKECSKTHKVSELTNWMK